MTIFQNSVKWFLNIFGLLFEKTEAICIADMLVYLGLLKTTHKSIPFLPFLINLMQSGNAYDDPKQDQSGYLTQGSQKFQF